MTAQNTFNTSEILAPDSYAMRVIRYRAEWLVGQKGLPADEQPDFEQEFSLRLLKRLKNYDPARSKLNTFLANSIRYEAHEILRQQFADKQIQRRASRSLDTVVGQHAGRRKSLGDFMTRSQQVRGRGRLRQDDEFEVDLHEDFQNVVNSLPPQLKNVCKKLLDARQPSRALRTVPAHELAAIRRHFEQAGLRNYL